MWVIATRAIAFFFGDEIIQYALYALGGLLAFTFMEAGAAQWAIHGMAFGQWHVGAPVAVIAPSSGNPVGGNPVVPVPIAPPVTGIVSTAREWLGVPYRFGGCDRRGVDCSCFTQLVYNAVGIRIPRVASDQYSATHRIDKELLVPGDLVFFANTYMPGISHVGIYIGNGQQINAPTEGQVVSIQPVFTGYWGAHYAGGGRP